MDASRKYKEKKMHREGKMLGSLNLKKYERRFILNLIFRLGICLCIWPLHLNLVKRNFYNAVTVLCSNDKGFNVTSHISWEGCY